MPRDLRPSEIVARLDSMAERWPDGYMLFSDAGALLLVRERDKRVMAHIRGIPNDGGDAGTERRAGKEYLMIDNV